MNLSKLQEILEDRGGWHLQSMGSQRVGHNLATEQQALTNTNIIFKIVCLSCSVMSNSCDPTDCSLPGSMGFSRQEYWNGLPCPSPTKLGNFLFISHQIKRNHNCWITKQHHFFRWRQTNKIKLMRELKTMLYAVVRFEGIQSEKKSRDRYLKCYLVEEGLYQYSTT